jgi:hypothetical protein
MCIEPLTPELLTPTTSAKKHSRVGAMFAHISGIYITDFGLQKI